MACATWLASCSAGRERGEREREQETESEHQAKTEAELAECGMVGRGSECDENHTALKE